MEADRKVADYIRDHIPQWEKIFAEWLEESIVLPSKENPAWLELSCSSGTFTTRLASRLPAGGRLIAVDERRELLEVARQEIPSERRRRVFFTRENPEFLSFADRTLDGVFCAGLPTKYDPEKVIGQAYRLLDKNGQLVLGLAVEGSFQEIFDLFEEILEREDLNQIVPEFKRLKKRFFSPAQLTRLMSSQGFIECRIQQKTHCLSFANGLQMVSSPVIRHQCLESLLGLIGDRSWREGILAGLVHELDVYFPQGVVITINIARVEGTKF